VEPDREQFQRFTHIIADTTTYPIFIHCSSGTRVGGLMLLHRVLGIGWERHRALEEARRIGPKIRYEAAFLDRLQEFGRPESEQE
jgi:protein tyrosine/serine phosphatase